MVQATADYCCNIENYLNAIHNTTNAIVSGNEDIDVDSALEQLENYTVVKNTSNTQIADVKVSLTLESKTSINLYVIPKDGYEVKASLGGNTLECENTKIEFTDGTSVDAYKFTVANVPADKLSTPYEVKLTTGDKTGTVTVSALAYANMLANSENTNISTTEAKKAMAALYYYSKAADNMA